MSNVEEADQVQNDVQNAQRKRISSLPTAQVSQNSLSSFSTLHIVVIGLTGVSAVLLRMQTLPISYCVFIAAAEPETENEARADGGPAKPTAKRWWSFGWF